MFGSIRDDVPKNGSGPSKGIRPEAHLICKEHTGHVNSLKYRLCLSAKLKLIAKALHA